LVRILDILLILKAILSYLVVVKIIFLIVFSTEF
jgi:hypothetical protein